MVCASALLLMGTGLLFAKPLLILFGASKNALTFARPYMMLYLLGTLPSMIATGMNPFINAQGYSTTGMFPWQSVQSQTFSWIRSLFLPSIWA